MIYFTEYLCDCSHESLFENIKRCSQCNCILCNKCMYSLNTCYLCKEQNDAIDCFDEIIEKGVFILEQIKNENIINNLKKELENARIFINQVKLQNEVCYQNRIIDVLVDSGELLDEISNILEQRIIKIIHGYSIYSPCFHPIY